jgi:hypothetical protein
MYNALSGDTAPGRTGSSIDERMERQRRELEERRNWREQRERRE